MGKWNVHTSRVLQSVHLRVGCGESASHEQYVRACHQLRSASCGWNVENFMDMSHMFRECNCNPHIDNWVVKKVVRVAQMFRDNHAFNGRLCGWDVQQLKDADAMFLNCDSGYAVWHVVCGDWDINAYGTN